MYGRTFKSSVPEYASACVFVWQVKLIPQSAYTKYNGDLILKWRSCVAIDAKAQNSTDGNVLNSGNFDSDGVNVDRNRMNDRNDNLGLSPSWTCDTFHTPPVFYWRGVVFFIQPPSICPISFRSFDNSIYPVRVKIFNSFAILILKRNSESVMSAFSKISKALLPRFFLARKISAVKFWDMEIILPPMV